SAPPRHAPPARSTRTGAVGLSRLASVALVAVPVAAALAAIAFYAAGGLQIERTTYAEIALILGCSGVAAAGIVYAPREKAGPLDGGGVLLAFAALAALTALSVIWSFQPSDSWLEASRTFAYLATFAAGISLVRLVPWGWSGLLHGVAAACVIISAWALL